MRFMVLIKADANTEAGVMPSEQLLAEMGKFNEELVKAGVMLAGEGLHPSAKGARVRFSGDRRTVVDGPFADTKELLAGYWLWQVKSKEEAIEWVKRCPNPTGTESEIEIRQVFEAADFGEAFTPELREQEDRLRAEVAAQAAAGGKGAVPAVPPARGAIPYLVVQGADQAIGYYQQVFGAELVMRLDAPDGKVLHSEMKVGPASFMVTEERADYQSPGPKALGGSAVSVSVFVPDVDATVAKAVAAGAQVTMPVQDQFWGDRCGHLVDPFGHKWFVSTHLEEPSPDEVRRRVQALFAQGAC
ncbi:hypothetical protein AAW51_0885 [Caldimonas brevitalea]|uniref:VOC domain-containing protein n=1 Tax=Caldimonas brevitalea TaxID=413882 RepID=A0A0G3BJL8_9BURK|nr:hypothetical protein AAW51_0885 [Caldimonas brevitalea]